VHGATPWQRRGNGVRGPTVTCPASSVPWWALELPKNKTASRRDYGVKDSWNDNGYYVEYVVPEGGLKAWRGTAAGQRYETFEGKDFYLPGGKEQLYIAPGSIRPSAPKLTNWPEP